MNPDHVIPVGRGTDDRGRRSAGAVEAVELAAGPDETLWRQVWKEMRWALRPPWIWLGGVAFNLVLSLLWLIVAPLSGRPHHDWAIIVGTYFAVWILADVTTTNVLGSDALRVRINFLRGIPLRRILVIKNLALMLLVGLPTLVATGMITVMHEEDYRLALTLPGVLFPILTWLGVGNFASVLLPVATCSWRERWRQRGDRRRTLRWLVCLALPYLLLGAVDPVSDLPRFVIRHLRFLPPTVPVRGAVLCALGLALWGVCTSLALALARLRPIRIR
jgi:hypothetical protein